MRRYESTVPAVTTRETPFREPTVSAEVAVPFWRAVISGGFLFVAIAGYFVWWPIGAAGTFVLIAWLAQLRNWGELLWTVEETIGADLDGDGRVGQPLPVEVWLDQNQMRRFDLPVPDLGAAVIVAWFQAALNNHSLSYARWERRFVGVHQGKRQNLYALFRQRLEESGLIAEEGNQGCSLTREGYAFAQQIVGMGAERLTPLLVRTGRNRLLDAPTHAQTAVGEGE